MKTRAPFLVVAMTALLAGCAGNPLTSLLGGGEYYPIIECAEWTYNASLEGAKKGTFSRKLSLVKVENGVTSAQVRLESPENVATLRLELATFKRP